MAKYSRNNNPEQVSPGFPARATDGGTMNWTAETDGPIVDKRGFGIIELGYSAFSVAVTATIKAGNESDGSDFKTIASITIDTSIEDVFQTDKLAAMPFFRVILNAADTDSMIVALT